MRCCARDEGVALRSRSAGGGSKPPRAALAEDRRGERRGKGAGDASGGDQEDGAQTRQEFAVDVSLVDKVTSKPGRDRSALGWARRVPADWPGGVRHVGDVSLICCSRTERGKACTGSAIAAVWRRREGASQAGRSRKGLSTDPGRAGGPACSSADAPAERGGGGAKRPGHL